MTARWTPSVRPLSAAVVVAALAAVSAGTGVGRAAGGPVLRFVPGSTAKVEQLLGEEDKERHQPTLSRTVSRYGIEGTDLGYSFEHDGRAFFLFGDTVGQVGRALDTVATTDARDPERGVRLDFLTEEEPSRPAPHHPRRRLPGRVRYLTVEPAGISMGAFEVPVSGISLGGRAYVVVSTNHSADRSTDRSVLTRFDPPATFRPLRTISQLPAGHFVKMSLHLEPAGTAGLPPGGPFVLVWGTGTYRHSDAYLAIVPASHFENGEGTRYFAGLDEAGGPRWSGDESAAAPVVRNGALGDLSVTWCEELKLWLMTADSRPPGPRGVLFWSSATPWGPWGEPQVLFEATRDGALGKFIHDPGAQPDDGLAGPVIGKGRENPGAVHGGAYAPYVVERFTRLKDSELSLYYLLSTWNPYVVVLMKSRLRLE